MPLIQSASDEALQKNIETLIKEGRDRDVALAIALDIQRRNRRKHSIHEIERVPTQKDGLTIKTRR